MVRFFNTHMLLTAHISLWRHWFTAGSRWNRRQTVFKFSWVLQCHDLCSKQIIDGEDDLSPLIQRVTNAQVAASRAIQDEELKNIASIAGRFLKRSRRANHRLLQSQLDAASGGGSSGDEGAKNGVGQGWVRQRIDVRTDEWHRVRALPLYCSSGRATPVGLGGEANRGQQGVAFVCPK